MFRLSKKTDYAIFLLTALARKESLARRLAGVLSEEPFQVPLCSATGLADISGVSSSLTANLLKDLGRAGILHSVRGQNGGYRLALPAREISLQQILEVFEGPAAFVECMVPPGEPGEQGLTDLSLNFEGRSASGSPRLSEACGIHGPCPAKAPMAILHNRILGLLQDLSLEEIAFHDLEADGLPLTHQDPCIGEQTSEAQDTELRATDVQTPMKHRTGS